MMNQLVSPSTAILCRAAVPLPSTTTGEMMYMPGGLQTITPFDGGIGQPIKVMVDAAGAAALESQRQALAARGKRAFFDFNHQDGPASFWPEAFFWDDGVEPGIYCRGSWSASGRSSVEGREWRQFSPVFHVDDKRGNPAHIVCRERAKPNMGGLVNDPAFHTILPLWAKDAAEAAAAGAPQETHQSSMTGELPAAAQARHLGLQKELEALRREQTALQAADGDDAMVAAHIAAREAELRASHAEAELDLLKAKADLQARAIAARNRGDAEAAVRRAIERGAIAARDERTQSALVSRATEDAAFLGIIDAMQGNPALGTRITASQVQVVTEAPNATMKAFAAIVCRNAKLPLSSETHREKGRLAKEAAALFARDIEKSDVIGSMPIEDAIRAADNAEASVGLLSGTLVLQRALPLLQYEYPMLNAITSDFSDAPGLLNQTETTRIILKHAVQQRSTAVDESGRPLGWNTVSPAQSVDVPVTLTAHVGVPVVFGQDILASTVRNLFAEQAPMALYALGGYAVNMVTELLTAENFNAYKGTVVTGAVTTEGDHVITVPDAVYLYPGQAINGPGIRANTYVARILDGTRAALTQAATASGTALTFSLSDHKVPVTIPTYARPLEDFSMACLCDLKAALDVNEVPQQERFALLNAGYHAKLAQDPSFNTFWAAMHKPEVITKGTLPELQGFRPFDAQWFPTSDARVGFAGHKAAVILKSRLPNDITAAVGAMVPGSVTTVTAPGGMSVLLVQYVSLREGYAEWRPEVMLGAAVGERRAGIVLTSV